MDRRKQLFSAIEDGDLDLLDSLLSTHPGLAEARNEQGVSAVLCSRYHRQTFLEARILTERPRLDVFDASAIGDVERVTALLDDDPELVSAMSTDGYEPLHLAAYFGQTAVVEVLLGRGANAEAVAHNESGLHPLNAAAAGGHSTIAHLLLDRGADVDARQALGYTPLHSAATNGDATMSRLLMDRGADPHARTSEGSTPLDLAASPEVKALLEPTSRPLA